MESKVIQAFKGEINGIEITNQDIYWEVDYIIGDIESHLDMELPTEFIKDFIEAYTQLYDSVDAEYLYDFKSEMVSSWDMDNRVDPKPTYLTKPAMIISTKDDTLNYESIGFAIGFKNADADDLLAMANGNALRLVPALQWLYGQTDDEGIRNRIEELTLDVLFNK